MLTLQVQTESYKALAARLQQARAQTDAVFEVVREDSLFDRPLPERHLTEPFRQQHRAAGDQPAP